MKSIKILLLIAQSELTNSDKIVDQRCTKIHLEFLR